MTELEEKFANLDVRQTSLETFMKLYAAKTDEQIRLQREEMKEFKAETSARFDKMDAKIDNMNRDLGAKIDSLAKFVQSMAVTAMIGMLGIAGSVVYFVYSVTPKP